MNDATLKIIKNVTYALEFKNLVEGFWVDASSAAVIKSQEVQRDLGKEGYGLPGSCGGAFRKTG